MKMYAVYRGLFLAISAADVITSALGRAGLHMILKPFIIITLLVFYFAASSGFQALFALALLVSLAGDIFLLYNPQGEIFFLSGLVSFLIAHILYILNYRRNRVAPSPNALQNVQQLRLAFPVLLAGSGIILFLYPLLGEMRIPVMVYSGVLVVMVLTALFRFGRTSPQSFWLVFSGAVFFMISDTALAVDKFAFHFPQAHTTIMLTYCLAQYLMVEGILKHEKIAHATPPRAS